MISVVCYHVTYNFFPPGGPIPSPQKWNFLSFSEETYGGDDVGESRTQADGAKIVGGVRKSRFCICGDLAKEMCSRSVHDLCQKSQLCSGNIWI